MTDSQEEPGHANESYLQNENIQEQVLKDHENNKELKEESRLARVEENPATNIQGGRRRNYIWKDQWRNTNEIEMKIRELYQKVDGTWRCNACDYSTRKNSSQIRRHVETHLNGLSYTCPSCNKEFKTRNSLCVHKHLNHK